MLLLRMLLRVKFRKLPVPREVGCNARAVAAPISNPPLRDLYVIGLAPAPSPPWVPSEFRSGLSFFVWDLAAYQLSHGSSADRKRSSRAAVADSGC